MKEIQEILNKVSQLKKDEKAILATVVDVQGSGYRRPGARMLIDENGYAVGTVSGGCLEADVLERAKKVLQTGEAEVITYDTTKDENSVFGLGMGCRGVVRILLENAANAKSFFGLIADNFEQKKSFFAATLITAKDEKLPIGARLIFNEAGIISSDFDQETADKILSENHDEKAVLRTYDVGEVFIERIKPPLNLLLFGAGFDALPLMKFAKELGWRITAIDHRSAFANEERLTEADEIIVSNSAELDEKFFQDENSVAVVMTHNYERDREILRRLISSKCRYIGALGPKKRTENLLAEIGGSFDKNQLEKLHAPVGLDIGADSPETIALSIIAEIQAVLKNRNGEFLRLREGSIYDR